MHNFAMPYPLQILTFQRNFNFANEATSNGGFCGCTSSQPPSLLFGLKVILQRKNIQMTYFLFDPFHILFLLKRVSYLTYTSQQTISSNCLILLVA